MLGGSNNTSIISSIIRWKDEGKVGGSSTATTMRLVSRADQQLLLRRRCLNVLVTESGGVVHGNGSAASAMHMPTARSDGTIHRYRYYVKPVVPMLTGGPSRRRPINQKGADRAPCFTHDRACRSPSSTIQVAGLPTESPVWIVGRLLHNIGGDRNARSQPWHCEDCSSRFYCGTQRAWTARGCQIVT